MAERNISFAEAFKAHRAIGDKTFEWNGKSYHTKTADDLRVAPSRSSEAGNSRGIPASAIDSEAGRSRGIPAGISGGRADAPRTTTSSGTGAGAGRGGQGGPSVSDSIMSDTARYDAGAGQGLRGTGVDGYKKGGLVKMSKSSTPYKVK